MISHNRSIFKKIPLRSIRLTALSENLHFRIPANDFLFYVDLLVFLPKKACQNKSFLLYWYYLLLCEKEQIA